MAIKDVFNNSSNNYLKTGLSPCTGADENIFQFFPKKEVGISSGNEILQVMNLGDIQIEVSAWDQHKKVLLPGEVTYIAGLTKGLDHRSQTFDSPRYIPDTSLLYMVAQFTIEYVENFKSMILVVDASSNAPEGINIENALDKRLAELNIGINTTIDTSSLTFTGLNEGYNFNITNVTLGDLDLNGDPVGLVYSIIEDPTKDVQYAKYINGAMLGVVMKVSYPEDQITYDKWLYLSHVNNTFSYYDEDTATYYTKLVDTGSSSASTSTVMAAGDYLNYITVNNQWDKVGYLYTKINTFDQAGSNVKNLVPGFYLFNPHTYNIEVDYMMIN